MSRTSLASNLSQLAHGADDAGAFVTVQADKEQRDQLVVPVGGKRLHQVPDGLHRLAIGQRYRQGPLVVGDVDEKEHLFNVRQGPAQVAVGRREGHEHVRGLFSKPAAASVRLLASLVGSMSSPLGKLTVLTPRE
jgi:hypothetical protein